MLSKTTLLLYVLAVLAVFAPVKSAPMPQGGFTIIGDDLPLTTGEVTVTSSPTATTTSKTSTSASPKAEISAVPEFFRQNALDAQKLNAKFATLNVDDACQNGEQACISGFFTNCVSEKWQVFSCGSKLSCFALPLQSKNGTGILCDVPENAKARFESAGVTGGITGSDPTGHCTTATATPTPRFTTLPASSFTISETFTLTVSLPKASSTISDVAITTIEPEPSKSANAALLFARERPPTTVPAPVPTTIVETPATSSSTPPGIIVIGFSTVPGSPLSSTASSSSSSFTPFTVAPTPTVIAPAGSAPVITDAPSSTVSTAGSSSTPIVSATGADGIVTVVILSVSTVTVTVPATACAPSNTIMATVVPSVPATLIPIVPSSSVTLFTTGVTATISPQETVVPVISASSSAPVISIFSPSAPASSSSSVGPVVVSSTTPAAGGFSFSTAPIATPAPTRPAEISNISELLTATVGGN